MTHPTDATDPFASSGASLWENDPELATIMSKRRQLLSIGYRLLGSLSEAEDVVQEGYTRWYALSPQERSGIDSPGGWLTTVVSRICLDLLGSARARRERYVGAWLPEPLPGNARWFSGRGTEADVPDLADRVALDESVTMAFLVVLDAMTPAERVAFVLHDVFCYPFADIAEIVGRSQEACRQLASSARRRVRAARPPEPRTTRHADVVRAFKQAWQAQDIDALLGVLAPEATATGDGGGRVRAELRPVEGAEAIARFYVHRARAAAGLTILERTVNGCPGLAVQVDGVIVTVLSFDIRDGRITRIWAVLNPDKLRSWTTSRPAAD